MSAEPTMGELTAFVEEHLPRGFSLRIRFADGERMMLYLYKHISYIVEKSEDVPLDLTTRVVRLVNRARGLAGLEPVEGTWDER